MKHPTAEEKLTTAIMPSDTVKCHQTSETLTVCGVNYERGELVPCGYPFPSLVPIASCSLIEKRYDKGGQKLEYIEALQKAGLPSFIRQGHQRQRRNPRRGVRL